MVRYKARQRISAKAALAHPYFAGEGLLALSVMQSLRLQLFRATQQDYGEAVNWVTQLMAKSGTQKEGGFTEAQLQELRVCFQSVFNSYSLQELLTRLIWTVLFLLFRKGMNLKGRQVRKGMLLHQLFGSKGRL